MGMFLIYALATVGGVVIAATVLWLGFWAVLFLVSPRG